MPLRVICYGGFPVFRQVLLVHQGSKISFSRVFDFEANDLNGEEGESRTSPYESRFPINIGITGYVATTGEVFPLLSHVWVGRFS